MKSLLEYIKESSSLFHDVTSPYDFDIDKAIKSSKFSIRIHKYENDELVLNEDYLNTNSIREFRSVMKKIYSFQEFSEADKEKYMMSVIWGNADKPVSAIYLTLYVSGKYNATLCLMINLQSNKIYEIDPFRNLKYPRRGDKVKLIRIKDEPPKWDGEFV